MKTRILLLSFLAVFCIAAKTLVTERLARPDKIEGVYIFTDSVPIDDYETLGSVKSVFSGASGYDAMRNALLQKAKKEHPALNGIIIRPSTNGPDKAEVIKFK